MRFSFLTLSVLAFLPAPCAASPKDELLGIWKFKRGIGGSCASEIRTLRYSFHKDGSYSSKATMSTGASLEYRGTFTSSDTSATAFVDGRTVGPFPYEIHGDTLLISQPDFGCKVELEREDY